MLHYTKSKKNHVTVEDMRWGQSLVKINDDLLDTFSVAMLHEIVELWEDGYKLEGIAEVYHLDPDEVFLALFDQVRKGKVKREFGYRLNYRGGKDIREINEIFPDAKKAR